MVVVVDDIFAAVYGSVYVVREGGNGEVYVVGRVGWWSDARC